MLGIFIKRCIALAVIVSVVLLVAQTTILPGIVERNLRTAFQNAGLPVSSLTMRGVSISHADFADIQLQGNQPIAIDSLQTDHTLLSLLHGSVNRIRLTGLTIQLPLTRGKLTDQLQKTLHATPSRITTRYAFPTIDITSSALILTRNHQHVRIPFKASVKPGTSNLLFTASAELLNGSIIASGRLSAAGALQQFTAKLKDIQPNPLPPAFYPALISDPLQGTLNGTASASRRSSDQWVFQSDFTVNASGHWQQHAFSTKQARLLAACTFSPTAGVQELSSSLTIDQAQLGRFQAERLFMTVSNRADTLLASAYGHGPDWNVKQASLSVRDYTTMLPAFARPTSENGIFPQLALSIQGLQLTLQELHLGAEQLTLESSIIPAAKHLLNPSIRIKSGAASSGIASFSGLNGSLAVSELLPLSLNGTQSISVDAAQFGGLHFSDGRLLLQMPDASTLLFERCDWIWCGGQLAARPFRISTARPDARFTAFFEAIQLDKLLQLTLPGCISGRGSLYGRIPVRLRLNPSLMLTFGSGHLYAVPSYGDVSITDPTCVQEVLLTGQSGAVPLADAQRDQLALSLENYSYSLLKVDFDRIQSNGISGSIQLRGPPSTPDTAIPGLSIPFSLH